MKSMIERVEVRDCPFCGAKVNVSHGALHIAPFYFFKCKNKNCGAVVSFDNLAANIDPKKAMENWNRRETSNE